MSPQFNPLKIALIGYGKMGKMVEKAALGRGHIISTIVDPQEGSHQNITREAIKGSDVCIDFSSRESAVDNIRAVAAIGKNMVVGTSGWLDHLDLVKQIVNATHTGLLYSFNMSIGVNLFYKIIAEGAQLIDAFDEYDVGCLESHHNQKADSPSGTVGRIADILISNIKRKKKAVYDNVDRVIASDELHTACLRCGSIPGTHSVIFDSPADTITLTHQARSREGFALGAVKAAEWIIGKSGVFTLDDLLADGLHK